MFLCTKNYTKGTVYSSVKAEAVTSGHQVNNNWAYITMHCLVYSRNSRPLKKFGSLLHGAVLITYLI